MGITLSIGVLIVFGLFVFGYTWDYPLRKIRALPHTKLHLMFIVTLMIPFFYIFFPEHMSNFGHVSRLTIRIISITLTGTLSFIYHYSLSTRESRTSTRYDTTSFAKYITLFISLLLCVYTIALMGVFFKDVLGLSVIPTAILSLWLGVCLQIDIKIVTELFLVVTKPSWKQMLS